MFLMLLLTESGALHRIIVSEMTAEEVANRNQTSIGAIKAIVFRRRTKAKKIAKENPNFLLIAPYLLILLGASKK